MLPSQIFLQKQCEQKHPRIPAIAMLGDEDTPEMVVAVGPDRDIAEIKHRIENLHKDLTFKKTTAPLFCDDKKDKKEDKRELWAFFRGSHSILLRSRQYIYEGSKTEASRRSTSYPRICLRPRFRECTLIVANPKK